MDSVIAQKKLEDSELRYRRLFETAQDGILILNARTSKISDVNPFLINLLGYSRDEFVEKKLWDVGAFKDARASQAAFELLQEKNYIRYEDLPLKTKNGRLIQVEFVSNVYLVAGKKVIQCNIRDITARRIAEENSKKINAELVALVAELQLRDRQMEQVIQINNLLQSCTTASEAYQVIAVITRELFANQEGCLAVLHNPGQHLEVVSRWGKDDILESAFLLQDCWAMRRGQPHLVVDPAQDLLCQHFVHPPLTGTFCLPLIVRGEILGLLSIVGEMGDEHSLSLRQLAEAVGEAIKLSLSNIGLRAELREQAFRDPLTGLYNRRYLEEGLTHELLRCQRENQHLCVAMVDIDDFKAFNDCFGHGAGDLVLRGVGKVFTEKLRNSDISCRYGGDEFLLVLPGSTLDETRLCLEQIRASIGAVSIPYREALLNPISVSIGIAAKQENNSNVQELISAADDALYLAKQKRKAVGVVEFVATNQR